MRSDQDILNPPKNMTILSKYELFVKRVSRWSGGVAVAMLLLIPLITFLDIVGSKVFNLPLFGAVEMTGLLQVLLLPAAAALTLLWGQHIKVEIFTNRLPNKAKRVLDSIISLLLSILIAIVIWQIIVYGMGYIETSELTNTLNWPLYPFIFLMALAFVPLCLAFFMGFLTSFKGEQ